jgi:hypothetical protein
MTTTILIKLYFAYLIFIFSFGYVLSEISEIFPKGKRTLFIQYFLSLLKRN